MRQMHAGLSFKDYDIETLNHQDDHAAHGDVGIDNVAEDEVRDVLEHISSQTGADNNSAQSETIIRQYGSK